jgi:Zn-dependent protease
MLITIFVIVALIMSAVVHEVAHGAMAYRLGDTTAKDLGRLTLNPFKHLDLFGSIILPLVLVLTKAGFFLAWAKPVPYNPYRLKDYRFGDLKVALAGPGANLIMATFFGLLARFLPLGLNAKIGLINLFLMGENAELLGAMSGSLVSSIFVLAVIFCILNLALMIFNLVPIPPLDGSKVALTFLPEGGRQAFYRLESYGIIILVVLIALGVFNFIAPLLFYLFQLIVGV